MFCKNKKTSKLSMNRAAFHFASLSRWKVKAVFFFFKAREALFHVDIQITVVGPK